MTDLHPGLYEQLLTRGLAERLRTVGERLVIESGPVHADEAADRISLHLSRLLRQAINALDPKERASLGATLARDVVSLLEAHEGLGIDTGDRPVEPAMILRALLGHRPDGTTASLPLPATPLLDTTLLTNAPGEPRVGHQLRTEFPSADRVDILMAFVRQTGIRPMLDLMRRHIEQGKRLRLLTTTYTGSTELAALEALRDLGAEVRVSYDTSGTRLHAKAWLFHRASGYSTAFIGSSNLTHQAQVTGLEWNVRVAGARNPDVIDKFSAVFESYWSQDDFRPFDSAEFQELARSESERGPRFFLSPVEIRPEPFQSRLLELIALARIRGQHRNLLVSATGTGKTVMAALDYHRLRSQMARSRLLFVAHRIELLEQSLATFRHALRDPAFGELWVGGQRPQKFEHVFASIQSLSAAGLRSMPPDHFDVVIIDEFHHAAADTYRSLLEHLTPIQLLGLTATPERGDNEPILHWFNGRIAAELRLWDAIDQQRLSPFAYYGISDGTDLSNLSWRRGRGYDIGELENILTADDALARLVIRQVIDTAPNPSEMRALGFCVSVKHARFMARHFSAAGIASIAVTGESSKESREKALKDLALGEIRVVFTVDLFNEGVDIPAVDTIILLRPTDSPTLFLQQLGRGLRRNPGKSVCTVLDFVGRHRKEFQFHRRLGALLGGGRTKLARQVEQGFPFLPSGCHMQLDAVATKDILRNLKESLPATFPARASELKRVAEEFNRPTLSTFIRESGIPLEEIYSGNHCWSDLQAAGGLAILPDGPNESVIRRAIGRLLHVDDPLRVEAWRTWLSQDCAAPSAKTPLKERRLMVMLLATLLDSVRMDEDSLDAAAGVLRKHPQVMQEINELLDVLQERIDHVQPELGDRPDSPLLLHARYTRREILAALGPGTSISMPAWREGVRYFPDQKTDVFVFTLDKSGHQFSPTTRYRDYAINRRVIHWESQSTTREDSETGRRYQRHAELGGSVLMFSRTTADERAFWFLGPASYVSHDGERPMAIRWQLNEPLSGDLFAQFAAAVS
jgi:superfamily II DNA or RNA helicase/HKD family nuclease